MPDISHRNPADDLAAGRALGADGFAAIDFETATGSRASACSVGAAIVRDGRVHEVRSWLIQPPGNEYTGFNIGVHGIRPHMTAASPTMAEVWPEVHAFVKGRPLVAHNASFDMSVLHSSLAASGRSTPDLLFVCTLMLSRVVWPGRLSYRLPDLADECGLVFQHHEAADDSAIAAELAVACCGAAGERELLDAVRRFGFSPRRLVSYGEAARLSQLTRSVDEVPGDSPFLGKVVVFTGALSLSRRDAAQIVVNAGGKVASSVSRKVDYLVVGIQDAARLRDGEHSSKMIKAADLVEAGAPIELLAEDDFLRMLPGEKSTR